MFARVTPHGWVVGDDSSASARVTPTGWVVVPAPLPVFHGGVGAASGATGSGTIDSPALATTTGRFLVVLVSKYQSGPTITGVTDTAGNTYIRAGSSQGGDSNHEEEVWFTPAPITGNAANVATVSFSATTSFRVIAQCEVSLAGATAMAFDAEAALRLHGTTSNSLTTTVAGALIIGGYIAWDTPGEISDGATGIAGWEEYAFGIDNAAIAYRVAGSAGSYSIDLSVTGAFAGDYAIVAKAFKFSTGGASPAIVLQSDGSLRFKAAPDAGDRQLYLVSAGGIAAKTAAGAGDRRISLSGGNWLAS